MSGGALTKAEMAERLFDEMGLNKREAKELVEQFFEEIRQSLEGNEQVKLSGFGNFDLRDKRRQHRRADGNVAMTGPVAVSYSGVIDPSLLG